MSKWAALESVLPGSAWNRLRAIRARFNSRYVMRSCSNSGEDMVLRAILKKRKIACGFYVDVGAYHPVQFSNTCYFYRSGWSGINIDARPGSMDLFRLLRPRDINVEAAIAEEPRELMFSIFDSSSLNTLDAELAQARASAGCRIVRQLPVKTRRLEEVLDAHLPRGQTIQFLSVDVEGYDLEVLRSNNWKKHRPELVIVECEIGNVEDVRRGAVHEFMLAKGYDLVAKTMLSLIFDDREGPRRS